MFPYGRAPMNLSSNYFYIFLKIQHKRMEMLNGMFGKMAEESIYQRKMIKKSEILSIKNI